MALVKIFRQVAERIYLISNRPAGGIVTGRKIYMNKIISIQLEYIFDSHWAAAIHRPNSTRFYHHLTESTWHRICNLRSKKQSGTLDGITRKFDFA